MPYSFTVIPDTVFDQVISFTLANTAKDNQEAIYDSYSEEHEFDLGDHNRISEGSNLLINPTARLGNAFWWGAGAAADYDTGDPDVEYANPPNFLYSHWTNTSAWGPFWSHIPATAWVGDLSEKIPLAAAATNVALSVETLLTGYVAGDCYVDIVCYDAGGLVLAKLGDLNGLCQIKLSATETSWTLHEATGTLPAGVSYVRIRKWVNATADATNFNVRRIKIELGTVARYFSDEATPTQYLSARYTSDSGQLLTDNVATIVNFENVPAGPPFFTWDDPGTNRVTVGANWEFEADRFMKLRVSAAIKIPSPVPWRINDYFLLMLFVETPPGAGFFQYAVLDNEGTFAVAVTKPISLQGSTTVYLRKGDKFRIYALQKSGANRALSNDQVYNYIDIEEI